MKQKEQVQIRMYNNDGYPFIATSYNLLLALDICNRSSLIVTSMNLGHTCLFHKGLFLVYFGDKNKNVVNLPYSSQRKHIFFVKKK